MTHSIEPIWPDPAPGALGNEPADVPTLTSYRPAQPDGSAVIVCPGGGYVFHAEYEADPVATWLTTLGVTGIVLRYRLAPRYRHPIPYYDARRAVRCVRARADEWNLDSARVGVMGFSAGGHLAALLATAPDAAGRSRDEGHAAHGDPVEQFSGRPSLCVLLYPVITFTGASSHTKSAENLLGPPAVARGGRRTLGGAPGHGPMPSDLSLSRHRRPERASGQRAALRRGTSVGGRSVRSPPLRPGRARGRPGCCGPRAGDVARPLRSLAARKGLWPVIPPVSGHG